MKLKQRMGVKGWMGIIVFIGLFYFAYLCVVNGDQVKPGEMFHLREDGCCVIKDALNTEEIDFLKKCCREKKYKRMKEIILQNKKCQDIIHSVCGEQYVFQDYIWIIEKSSVHTCHRDNNGTFFNKGQKHPSYSALIYLEDRDQDKSLGVIPKSHTSLYKNNVNLWGNSVETILCNTGDIIIFNANLIHVGTVGKDNLRVQLKISNKDDLDILHYYQNFNKISNQDNTLPERLVKFQKNASCMFPVVSDWTQTENIKSARGSDNNAEIGMGQKIFSYLFYGKSDYYDLPNAF